MINMDATPRLRNSKPGFALVVTLSLMILLTVIAVGLLSLSSLSLRGIAAAEHEAAARANARLALMIALGEVQRELGPDRRISANSAILDDNPDSPEADGIEHPRYLGVWESWNTWLTDNRDKLTLQQTYQSGRHPSLFRRWLVSDPNFGRDLGMPKIANPATLVPVVGSGSLGAVNSQSSGEDSNSEVRVPLLTIVGDGISPGGYAYWVADENQKARIDQQERQHTPSPQAAQVVSSNAGRPGVETMNSMEGLKPEPEVLSRMITPATASVTAPKARARFHDLTSYSLGLLTDVRAGGFRGDLNHAFEQDSTGNIPREMRDQVTLFGTPFDPPIRPMTGSLLAITPQNKYVAPMSWRQMREYYRMHKTSSRNIMKPLEWRGGSPLTSRFVMGKKRYDHVFDEPDTMGYARQLVLLRQSWIIAARVEKGRRGGTDRRFICAVPFMVYWNPYNVPMKVASNEISSTAALSLATMINYKVYDGRNSPSPEKPLFGRYNYLGYSATPEESPSGDINFEPGEVRGFSVVDSVQSGAGIGGASHSFFATPGYTPLGDTLATRGLQYEITEPDATSFSLRLAEWSGYNDNHYWGNSPRAITVGIWQNNAGEGLYEETGNPITKASMILGGTVMSGLSIDWFTHSEINDAWLVEDAPSKRALWNTSVTHPVPVAIISVIAKSPERLLFANSSAKYADDFRNRTWLHAPPTGLSSYLINPGSISRSNAPYQIHFRPVNGDQEVSQYLQVKGRNAYYGGGYGPSTGQTHLVALDLPSAPLTGIAAFAGARIDHARARMIQPDATGGPAYPMFNLKHLSHQGAAFGPGIGNSYSHPMIGGDKVYQRVNLGRDAGHTIGGFMSTNMNTFDDYWDHLFLANEGLWDSWFCSGLAPEMNAGRTERSRKHVTEAFYKGEPTLVNPSFKPYTSGKTSDQLTALTDAADGWQKVAAYLLNEGQFNVNSTSTEAWKAVLMGLRNRPVAYQNATGGARGLVRDQKRAAVSRFTLASSPDEGTGPADSASWLGIRHLTDDEIEQLAKQMVRQVKLRGPFLNLAEFVNRRLTHDRTGVTGAIQAAIDSDEFDADYNGTVAGGGASINDRYKTGAAMISSTSVNYPNPKAALGSRYAGIPGYVMQSDILQGIGSSIAVRGDTFLIRGYGESRANGRVVSRAWCEAVVQRLPEYIDAEDAPEKWLRAANGSPVSVGDSGTPLNLSHINRRFGRRFGIVSFRWLTPSTI
jgi:hypothetical protein